MDLNKLKETVENLTGNEKVKEVLNSDVAKTVLEKVKDVKKENVEDVVNVAKDLLSGLNGLKK
ncbi:MAG: hypothetical protein IJ681_09930 [Bacteroidales bacterium]|nr:hypothetical protein [Bacteroidales bacterium]